jgi:hypothetical protein
MGVGCILPVVFVVGAIYVGVVDHHPPPHPHCDDGVEAGGVGEVVVIRLTVAVADPVYQKLSSNSKVKLPFVARDMVLLPSLLVIVIGLVAHPAVMVAVTGDVVLVDGL